MSTATACETVCVTLSPSECKQLVQLAERTWGNDPVAQILLHRLREGASLAVWLRDQTRLELSLVDAALLRDLRHLLRQPREKHLEEMTVA